MLLLTGAASCRTDAFRAPYDFYDTTFYDFYDFYGIARQEGHLTPPQGPRRSPMPAQRDTAPPTALGAPVPSHACRCARGARRGYSASHRA